MCPARRAKRPFEGNACKEEVGITLVDLAKNALEMTALFRFGKKRKRPRPLIFTLVVPIHLTE